MKIYTNGFTLIELIIVVSILLLMMGGSLATFNSFNDQKNIEAEGKKFASTVDLLKKKAISGDTSDCSAGMETTDYRITYNQNSYSIQVQCDTVITTLQTFTLPLNFSFTTSDTIIFVSQGSGTLSDVNPIIISNANNSKCYKLTVHQTGVLDEEGPSAAACE